MKKISTKDKIVKTCREIIAKEGLSQATAGNISSLGDFTKSSIFYYFESIDQLLLYSLKESVQAISPILDPNFQAYPSIDIYLQSSMEDLINHPENIVHLRVILSFIHQTLYIRESSGEIRDMLLDKLYQSLVAAITYFKRKDLDPDEVENLASLILATFNGLGVHLLLDGSNKKFLKKWQLQLELIANYIG